jgi:hypothetical protein
MTNQLNALERYRQSRPAPLPGDDVAEAIYNANRGEGAWLWANVSDEVRDWVRRQARAAEEAIARRNT